MMRVLPFLFLLKSAEVWSQNAVDPLCPRTLRYPNVIPTESLTRIEIGVSCKAMFDGMYYPPDDLNWIVYQSQPTDALTVDMSMSTDDDTRNDWIVPIVEDGVLRFRLGPEFSDVSTARDRGTVAVHIPAGVIKEVDILANGNTVDVRTALVDTDELVVWDSGQTNEVWISGPNPNFSFRAEGKFTKAYIDVPQLKSLDISGSDIEVHVKGASISSLSISGRRHIIELVNTTVQVGAENAAETEIVATTAADCGAITMNGLDSKCNVVPGQPFKFVTPGCFTTSGNDALECKTGRASPTMSPAADPTGTNAPGNAPSNAFVVSASFGLKIATLLLLAFGSAQYFL